MTWVKILLRTGTRVGSGIRHLAHSLNQTPPRSVSMLFCLKFHLHMDRTIIGPWLAIFSNSRIKISSFLAMNIKKCVLLAQKLLNFLKLPQTKNGNYNSLMFQQGRIHGPRRCAERYLFIAIPSSIRPLPSSIRPF